MRKKQQGGSIDKLLVNWLKVRTRFPQSDVLEKSRVLFKRKGARRIFICCLSTVRFGSAMSSLVSGVSEDSAGFPILGADLSEPSAKLPDPGLFLVSGK